MATPSEGTVWFITGTSRGIGLEFTRRLLRDASNTVLAACRTPATATALHALATAPDSAGTLHVLPLEMTDKAALRALPSLLPPLLGERGIDYLINNAGINGIPDTAFTMDADAMEHIFRTNVVGPALLSQVLLPRLEAGRRKVIANVSSSLGSVGSDYHVAWAAYSITKSGLNMLTYKQQKERPELTVVSLCPGWLQTDLGGKDAPLPVHVGVDGLLAVIHALTPADKGRFIEYTGRTVPW